MKRFLKVLGFLTTTLLLLLLGASVVLAISARRSPDRISTVVGHKLLSVLSGSMEPAINTGDVIILKPFNIATDEIQVGDVITFRTKSDPNMMITHRVIGIAMVNDKPSAYVMKGDNNDSPDVATVTRQQIVGIYRWRIPYFGYISSFIRQPVGLILFVILPGLVLIGMEFKKIWTAVAEAEKAQAESAQTTGGDRREA